MRLIMRMGVRDTGKASSLALPDAEGGFGIKLGLFREFFAPVRAPEAWLKLSFVF
jgi:hypothetical protein